MIKMEYGMTSLYERLGGEKAVNVAVDLFYKKIYADKDLLPFFDNIDRDKQAEKQRAFLTMAFGGDAEYNGKDMRTAHAHLVKRGLNEEHFNKVVAYLGETLSELGIDQDKIQEAATVAQSVKNDVLNIEA